MIIFQRCFNVTSVSVNNNTYEYVIVHCSWMSLTSPVTTNIKSKFHRFKALHIFTSNTQIDRKWRGWCFWSGMFSLLHYMLLKLIAYVPVYTSETMEWITVESIKSTSSLIYSGDCELNFIIVTVSRGFN